MNPLKARAANGRWWQAATVCLGLALGAGAAWSQPGAGEDAARAARDRMVAAEMRSRLLAQENEILRQRVAALERQAAASSGPATPAAAAASAGGPESAPAVLALAQPGAAAGPGPAAGPGARQLALRGSLQDFFETASLVDQTLEVRPLPEGGYLQHQLQYMRTVRDYLRNEGSVAGVNIRDVDRRLPMRELADIFLPQNAVYLNAYAMGRLRDQGDAAGFPLTLRYLMNSTMLIQEFEILSDPTGQIAAARQFQKQLELERERARGLAEGLGRGVQTAAPAILSGTTPAAGR